MTPSESKTRSSDTQSAATIQKSKEDSIGIRQVLRVLGQVAAAPDGAAFNELRRQLGNMPAPTLSRLLRVATEEGWTHKDENGHYRPGFAFLRAANQARSAQVYTKLMEPIVSELAKQTGQSATYVEWQDNGIVFRAKREMPDSFHYIPIGAKNTSVMIHGFALLALAFQDESVISAQFAEHKDHLLMPEPQLRALLNTAKTERFIQTQDKGLRLGAPIFVQDTFIGVIGISLMGNEHDSHEVLRLKKLICKTAKHASVLLERK